MLHARIEAKFDTIPARLLVAFLALVQPLGRGWARYFTWLKFKRTPKTVIASEEQDLDPGPRGGSITHLNFWNEKGVGREKLLEEIFALLETEGWRYSTDTGWKEWDVQIYGNFWWIVKLQTVTEYHGGPKCLTRVRLRYRMVVTTFLANVLALCVLIYRETFTAHSALWLLIPYGVFLFVLYLRARRLKSRTADLVMAAASRCDLTRMRGDKARPRPAA
jgi:hypothetical protein